jgi:hypothetical protein
MHDDRPHVDASRDRRMRSADLPRSSHSLQRNNSLGGSSGAAAVTFTDGALRTVGMGGLVFEELATTPASLPTNPGEPATGAVSGVGGGGGNGGIGARYAQFRRMRSGERWRAGWLRDGSREREREKLEKSERAKLERARIMGNWI